MFSNLCEGEPKLYFSPCCGIISDVRICKTFWSISLLPSTPASKSTSSSSSEPDESVALYTILSPSVSSNNSEIPTGFAPTHLLSEELYWRTLPSTFAVDFCTSSKNS